MSSLIGSVSTAVTGLMAQSTYLGNISDNLANTTTTGFKTIGTSFQDIVATASSQQTGIGTLASPTYYNSIQGSISNASAETYMAISGKGFFPVRQENDDGTSSTAVYYTRSGDFMMNKDGLLENSAGYSLLGWAVNPETGTVTQGTLVPVQFSDFFDQGVVTSRFDFEANLPATADIGADPSEAQTTFYDSNGDPHDVTYSWEKTDLNTWDLTVTIPGGAGAADLTGTATFTFDGQGQIASITSPDFTVSGTSLALPVSFTGTGSQPITANFDKLTQFADTTIDVSSFAQNGTAAGSFSSMSIDENGMTSAIYDNGVVRTYYQIPLATFYSPESLQKRTGGVFQETDVSGTASYNAPETSGAGKIIVSALENSTVDIADQFTRMIQAQRAYTANAKTVSVADAMIQTLVTI